MGCRGAAPARAEADRPQGSAGGNGVALWGAETASPAELPRAGILPYRLGHVPGLRPSAGALDTEESVLQNTISAISAATWERINRHLLRQARTAKLESGEMLRVDSTVTDAPVHPPTDSSLLWDSVRMMVRLLGEADDLLAGLGWRNHSRRAKKRSRSIQFCRSADKRKRLYRDLLKVNPRHPWTMWTPPWRD